MTQIPIDIRPFLDRHNRRSRATFAAMLALTLVLSAIVFTDGMRLTGSPGVVIAGLWHQIVMGPLTIGGLWIASALYARSHPVPPAGPLPMNPDDARNVVRVANAGYVFVTGFGAVMIAGQAYWVLLIFGVLHSPEGYPDWGLRAVLVAVAALMIYFGNVSPRMPTARTPEANPAVRMRYNRFGGWMTVIFGVLLALAALALPKSAMVAAIGILSLSLLLVFAAGAVMFHLALKSRSA